LHHGLNGYAFVVERGIGACKVMLDERFQAAAMIAIGDFLKQREILQDLIEPSAEALAVLSDEARDTTGGNDAHHQDDSVDDPA
jgi:hypothetical protein